MDLIKTGKFIAELRKEKNLTQAKLAEILEISEKTISKWECGNGFPDTSLILPLCEALEISANELLSGCKLNCEEYKKHAEENLIELKNQHERNSKHLLAIEWVLVFISVIPFVLFIYLGLDVIQNLALQIILISIGSINLLLAIYFSFKIEKDVGYYECAHCHHKYIPSYKSVFWALHIGRTRYLKCPKCHKHSWNKKTLKKD
ncbi:MAG: helix-turn-helix transcriptional regulator [Clostridia bacterium]|nr:helix-turn-helix transcriptional regulator [Clostridia bacterium]